MTPLLMLIAASQLPVPHNLLGLIALLTWVCYDCTDRKSFAFLKHLPSHDVVYHLCASLGLIFAPGLWEVLHSATPPTTAWFEQLPRHDKSKKWGVYILVLQKLDSQDLIYCGSATNSEKGINARFANYDNLERGSMPKYLLQAIDDGYRITSKGLLVKAPIPALAIQDAVRLLFIAIETLFTFIFWALRVPNKGEPDYLLGKMCL